jgi:hypothetical protein
MADPAPNDWLFNGPPVPAIAPAAAPAPVAQSLLPPQPAAPQPSGGPPPLPDEPGSSLIARAALAEGDQNNPDSWRGIAGVILNRVQKTGKTVAQVLSEPGQFEAYQNGHIQSVDTSSPAFQAALDATKSVTAGPYDSFYQPQIVAQRGVRPPFDPSQGTKIGSQLFGNGYAGGGAAATPAAGLSDSDLRAWLAVNPNPQTNPTDVYKGGGAMTAEQQAYAQQIEHDPSRGFNPKDIAGTPSNPYFLKPDSPEPTGPAIHWVDLKGKEHVNPGGLPEQIGSVLSGAAQGLGMDQVASASRLTGGGLAVGDPMMAALSQSEGGPSALDMANAAQQGSAQQQQQYALQHVGDPYAQAGRFGGQAIPATLAAATVPELEAPSALGTAGRMAAQGATNALRGVAAVAPSVGANPNQSVASQLAGGALAGVAVPGAMGAIGKGASALTGLGRTVSPEVAALADAAQNKYGIQLRSGQVMGANGDRGAAVADSNLLTTPKARANNDAQRQAWMKGVTNTYGDPSGLVTPEALSAAKANVVAPMNDVATRTNLNADAVQSRLGEIIADAQSVLPDNEVMPLLKQVENIGSVRQGDVIPGDAYQALTRKGAPLDRLESSDNPNVSHYATQIRGALDDALQASASPEDVRALQQARFQYKNLMTVAKLAPKADVSGVISPALLRGAVGSNFKNQAFQGAGDLGELAQIGQTFMKEPPQSGTAPRLADFAGPFGVGAGLGAISEGALNLTHHPDSGLSALASMGLATGGKMVAQAIKENRVGGSASGIIARSIPGSPGAIGSALSGLKQLTRPVEIPLSALAGVRLPNSFTPSPAVVSPQP